MSHGGGFGEGEIKGLRQCCSLKNNKKKKTILRGLRENSQSGSNFTSSPLWLEVQHHGQLPAPARPARKTEQSCRRLDNIRRFLLSAEDWTGET